jgi:hypothetical protein
MMGFVHKRKTLTLFGGYYAEATNDGTFFVRENGLLKSPHEYSAINVATSRSYVLFRAWEPKVDILFSDLSWFLGAIEVYVLAHVGGKGGFALLMVVTEDGTHVMTDNGRDIIYVCGFPHISVFNDRFLVVYDPEPPGPYVKVYNLRGELVSEGLLWEARKEALAKSTKRQRS